MARPRISLRFDSILREYLCLACNHGRTVHGAIKSSSDLPGPALLCIQGVACPFFSRRNNDTAREQRNEKDCPDACKTSALFLLCGSCATAEKLSQVSLFPTSPPARSYFRDFLGDPRGPGQRYFSHLASRTARARELSTALTDKFFRKKVPWGTRRKRTCVL